ncbi:MAG TPA: lytic transglycosylase domain-containing protein [Pyrinomonadaceae bacterium]|jgi:soluble lytic murein transglycosylase-like protein|nr:lytic transglycosylase domain-containing protein [Pyrinomonadaceae bacterium]
MKFPRRLPHFRSLKFAPFALVSLFVFSNVTGILFSHVLAPAAAATQRISSIPADMPTSGDPELDRIIFNVGEKQGVDPRFIHAVIWQESKYDTHAHSHAGAQGLMQLIPATAKRFGCEHPEDPEENITAGTKYLAWLLKRFSGDVELTLAGYNAGEGSVDKYDGVPPYDETRNYVKIITERYGKTYHPMLTPAEAAEAVQLHTATSD